MKRDTYIKKLKKELIGYCKERAEEDGTEGDSYDASMEDIKKAVSIGELFVVMSDMAFDVPGAVGFAMRIAVSDCSEFEFMEVPMRNWDT